MNAQEILKYGHLHLERTIADLPFSHWQTGGVCGVWSVREVIAHLASYENLLVDVLCAFYGETNTPTFNRLGEVGPEKFNDVEVALRAGKSPEEVLIEYRDTQMRNASLAARLSPEQWREVGSLPWYGADYSLDDFIFYSFYGHKREHSAQIEVFKDSLKAK